MPELSVKIALACYKNDIFDLEVITEIATLTGASLLDEILPLVGNNVTIWHEVVLAGQEAYASAYPWVYYVSIAFGVVSILASIGLGDISKYMDDHVAVVIH